jgi:hypothetical protein
MPLLLADHLNSDQVRNRRAHLDRLLLMLFLYLPPLRVPAVPDGRLQGPSAPLPQVWPGRGEKEVQALLTIIT